ncbi:hypothetical protein FNF31_02386 [Cafeteria roenbergensis]|uniref:Band 7 domain-containing protein n=1 Tax=Cafeteria roenbergensis TaxID=33653 RepID=A0A5A8DGJ7_CAFRO|nr:hypothetical protein FNF31_02386 [Cafeteria roenbergensis]KAA0170061.1 hypothetical protein FNF28_01670 [Cafeteria roenbergensis]
MGRGTGLGRGRGGELPFAILCGGASCCCLIISISLISASFGIVETSEYGLRYDVPSMRIAPEVYENGRHFPGLGSYFVKYPRKLTYMEFSSSADGGSNNGPVTVWSKDGQEIVLEAGFYIRLRKADILEIYYAYQDQVMSVIEDVAANAMRDVATGFTTLQFFTNRSSIDERMSQELGRRISACCYADVEVFNMLGIDVPSSFRVAVENVVISQQERTTLEILRDAIVLRQSIRVVDAQADKTILVAKSDAQATGLITRSQAQADVQVLVEKARAQSLFNLSTALGFANGSGTNMSQLLSYMYADVIRSNRDVVVNVPRALVSV